MSITKAPTKTETKLTRIAYLSVQDHNRTFGILMHHINEESLEECFKLIDGNKAKGIDNISKKEYGEDLKENLSDLMSRMKRMGYRPQPVKRVMIPKENGKTRPLGISVFEDKIVQKMTQRILEAIYDPIFKDCSYGFRPRKGCHDAIKALRQHLDKKNNIQTIIDVDLADFFNTIDHDLLVEFLRIKIQDPVFMRYIVRMLKAGVLTKGEFSVSEEGVPQGNICSPVLSGVFAHYVIDEWFVDVVPQYCRGKVKIFRYADDAVICCEYEEDALKVKDAFAKRLAKYKLKLNEEKTKMISFSKRQYAAGKQQGSFDFLGFTFYLGRAKAGFIIPKLKTKKKSFRAKLKRVKEWIMEVKDKYELRKIWDIFYVKIRGHIQYYGVSFNFREVHNFIYEAIKIVFRGLNRRSQKKSFSWDQFNLFMDKYPPPKARIAIRLF
jgi:RNA-directed DNA polymerase